MTEVIPTADEDQVIGHLGPDLLGPDWDPALAVRLLARDPDKAIGEALLDQRNLAGVGTVFATEMMFLRGIHPWRPVGTVLDLDALVDLGHRLLDANKGRPGTSPPEIPGPDDSTGSTGGREKPCRRCGTVIKRGEQGPPGQERIRFWCPNCQR